MLKHSRWRRQKRRENVTEKPASNYPNCSHGQLEGGSQSFAARGVSAVRGVRQPLLSGEVPRLMEPPHKAIEDRAHEEGRPSVAQLPRGDAQLIPGKRAISAGRKSYGFRTYEAIETAIYHKLGRLPQPEFTHRFW